MSDPAISKAQADLQARARALAESHMRPRAAEIDRTEQYPWDHVAALAEGGFMGMTIPVEFGGKGASALDAVLVIEEMAKCCGVAGRITVEANMGAVGAIMAYGTPGQKQLAARLVLAGDKPAICISEPEAGSAATEMTTRAERTEAGWVLNGRKHWITGGGVSKLHLVFARVVEHGVDHGIGGFIVARETPADAPGLTIGAREPAMGLRGIPETVLDFQNLLVPDAMVLRAPGGWRKGFAKLIDAYNGQRLGAATVALGLAAGAHALAVDYARRRRQFGRAIAEFQGLQWMLADAAIEISAARALIHAAARSVDRAGGAGFPCPVATAKAKIFASEMAIRVTNVALQAWGSAGYSRNNPMERYVRDARMFAIAGGTAQVLRNLVASDLLGMKLPQTRDGYLAQAARAQAAE